MTLDNLTQRLRTIADREGRSPEAILQELLDAYEEGLSGDAPKDPID
ncbi:MAG: hypothetical protein GYB65_23915 [Chloroflexi bacterium]|nr:hypothetical protein [Chloroflexota bacterium]